MPDNTKKNCLTLASNTVVKSKIIGAPIVYKDTKITIPGMLQSTNNDATQI